MISYSKRKEIIMEKIDILKHVSFHDEKKLKAEFNNDSIKIFTNDDLGNKYTFIIKNARIEANSLININEISNTTIIALTYEKFDDNTNYIYLELFNPTSPFHDEFYIYSNDIEIINN